MHIVSYLYDILTGAQVASGQTALTKCTVPVYAAGILGAFGEVETVVTDTIFTLIIVQYAQEKNVNEAYTNIFFYR